MVKTYNGETYIIPEKFEEEVRAEERKKAFKEFVDLYREFCKAPSDESCLIKDECEGMCIDCFEKWLQKKEQK